MASYKVICKARTNSPYAVTAGDVSVYDGEGKLVNGLSSIRFTASVGEMPKLELTTMVENFELEIPEENINQ